MGKWVFDDMKKLVGSRANRNKGGFMVVVSNIFVFCASLDRKEKTHFDEHLFIEFKTGWNHKKNVLLEIPPPRKGSQKLINQATKNIKNIIAPKIYFNQPLATQKKGKTAKQTSKQKLQAGSYSKPCMLTAKARVIQATLDHKENKNMEANKAFVSF